MEQVPAEQELQLLPPPVNGVMSPPEPLANAINREICFFARALHLGHLTALSESLKERFTSNVLPQAGQLYSYLGITSIF